MAVSLARKIDEYPDSWENRAVFLANFKNTSHRFYKAFRFFTGAQYFHLSIALDKDLSEMYSFYGKGIVKEKIHRFPQDMQCQITRIPVTEEQYHCIRQQLKEMYPQHYNYAFWPMVEFRLFFAPVMRRGIAVQAIIRHMEKVTQYPDQFCCSPFIAYILGSAGIRIPPTRDPKVWGSFGWYFTMPEDYIRAGFDVIYRGDIKGYFQKSAADAGVWTETEGDRGASGF